MSSVTDVVIHHAAAEDYEMAEKITEPQEFMDSNRFEQIPYRLAGGSKAFQGDVYMGAFNYLNVEALAHWFMQLPWPKDAHAIMSVSVENEAFGLLVLDNGQAEWSMHAIDAKE
jgi:hypothetical protein